MRSDEARVHLGFPPNSCPTPSQISEAYNCLLSGAKWEYSEPGSNVRVVRRGVPMANCAKGNPALVGIPFLFIILGTLGLGGFNASRAYNRQKEINPTHNPFLP
ncbi:hypothetical protein BT93_K2045 [Corymbia citriodora subsp. variegata]|nr:hypothetical protein BT93_K2045 [Corymbia citriodora subsp. variegata]